ncbi:hypothetical protein [Emticicia sp. SJ17W-69]|uniref:hypothetical protein n=1 Tax=Emticicia sp. SJ17W-69 TaxID=3421657 RepID=UPI003EC08827
MSCFKETIKNSRYIGTKWTTNDDISESVYGKNCTTTIEFLNLTNCQVIDRREVKNSNLSGVFVKEGFYKIKGDSVFWTIDKVTTGGIVRGSVMVTNMKTITGGNRVYSKN